MKPKSSGLRAQRSLSFEERPYAGKTFYLDVKSASAKSKISQRIQNLGGQIEDFLSKDLTLLITDKSSTKLSKDDYSQKQTTKNVPLSRGQALLLKSSANQNCDANNNSNGLLQSAAKLGLRIETPAAFLRDSAKHLQKLKAETSRMDTSMSGMSPITWDSEKENGPVIKVEDEDGLYRPLFKQFETFPKIFYNETGSPFDAGVVLTKAKESNNQSKKKSAGGVLRGGYCESCDHWYKCSLREHLNSEKHKEFVSIAENFKTLNHTSSHLPNLQNFVGKYGLKGCKDSQEMSSKITDFSTFPEFDSHYEHVADSELNLDSYNKNKQGHVGQESLIGNGDKSLDSENKIKCRHASKTEPISKRNITQDPLDIPHSQPLETGGKSISMKPIDIFKKKSLNEFKSNNSELKSENSFSRRSSQRIGRKFSINDVIQSVTDNEDYFSSGDDDDVRIQDPMSKTSCIITKHLNSEISANVSSLHSLSGSSHRNVALGNSEISANVSSLHSLSGSSHRNVALGSCNSNRETMPYDVTEEKSKQASEVNPTRLQNIPTMYFSSSSFGDNGVNNVLSFLNSQHSKKSCDREDQGSGKRLFDDYSSNVECSGNSSWALDKLSEVTDSKENIPGSGISIMAQCADNGNVLEHLIDDISCDDNEMPVLEVEVDSDKMEVELDLMPVLQTYDSEDGSRFSETFLSENKVQKPPAVASIPLPEYSNITEESLQDKPQLETKHVPDQNLQSSYDIPMFNLRNNIIKDGANVTPDKNLMNNLKSKIYECRTNSGSTIRNWLLPNDDTGSIRSVQSPGNLNATLVNTSCNVLETSQLDNSKDIDKDNSGDAASLNDCSLNEIKETGESSKVADWIQRQDFVVAQNADDNSRHDFEANILEAGFPCSVDEKELDTNEKDLKSCSEKRYGSDKADIDEGSYVWSDSGTSISDCTLDNFRYGAGVEDNLHAGVENSHSEVKDITNEEKTKVLMLDEMSQDSNVSAKTGLTSIVTARGIKISGLSSLSSHFFNAVDSDVFTETESSTVAYGISRRNSDCSFADSVNKIGQSAHNKTSDSQPNNDQLNPAFNNSMQASQGHQQQASQGHQQKNGSVSYDYSSEFNYSSDTKSKVGDDIQSSQKKTNLKAKSSAKKQSQTKKPRAAKTTKSKKQAQSHNLLNQVLTANMYSPVSSFTENSPSRNSYTDQTYTQYQQTSPYSQQLGQEHLSSPGFQQVQGSGNCQQNQFVMNGQLHGTNLQHDNLYHQGNGEFRMMDLLLSPGEHVGKFNEGKFQQNVPNQQQSVCPQGNVSHPNNVSFNGGYAANFLTQQNIQHQFGILPFTGHYQNQGNVHANKENNPHFLSSNSNFFMHNWNTSTSAQQQSHSAQQEPVKHLNFPASPGNMSHDQSRSNGSLQTIEMSHIADSNGGCDNNFNFKIADTQKLKSNCNVKKKPKEKKLAAQRKKGRAVSQNITVQPSQVNNQCVSSDNSRPVENGHCISHSIPSLYSQQNQFPNVYVSSHSSQPATVSHSPCTFNPSYSGAVYQTYSGMSVNPYSNSQPVNVYENTHIGNVYSAYNPVKMYSNSTSVNVYNTTQTGDTKLKISRAAKAHSLPASKQTKHDLMQYWNVRKAGDCRLVFSANMLGNGKRKAEAETPTKMYLSPVNDGQNVNPAVKRRKCLVY